MTVQFETRRAFWTALVALGAVLIGTPAEARTVIGPAVITDGDTLQVRGTKIRLVGIDAPEAQQSCNRAGEAWHCGAASTENLRTLIADRQVTCAGTELDQHLRLLAVCTAGSVELNRAMVAEGWATAFRRYSNAYVGEEEDARANKRGLWASEFTPPEDHRRAEDRAVSANQTPSRPAIVSRSSSSCSIKGNRNRRGEWIYHLPGMPYYKQTRAEEMFCTEAQAQAAGYRKSRARR